MAMAAAAATAILRSVARRTARTHRPLFDRGLHGGGTSNQELASHDRKLPSGMDCAKAQFKRNSIYTAYFLFGGFVSYALAIKPTLDKMKENAEATARQRRKRTNDVIQHIEQEFERLTAEIEQIISDEIPETESTESSGHGKEGA